MSRALDTTTLTAIHDTAIGVAALASKTMSRPEGETTAEADAQVLTGLRTLADNLHRGIGLCEDVLHAEREEWDALNREDEP